MYERSKATLSRYKQQASSYYIHEWINLMQHICWVYIHSTIFTLDRVLRKKNFYHDPKSSLNYSDHNVCYSFALEAL